LYEAELLFANRSAIDLGGADLSGIILTGHVGLEINYDHIALTHVVLTNTSFVNLHLLKANLSGSLLTNANFSNAYLYETNLAGCDLRNADLRGNQAAFVIMRNNDLSGAILSKSLPQEVMNSILPNGSYVFYSNDSLQSDLFNESVNLIINGDMNCQTNINSTEIFGWENRSKPIAIIKNYSELPSFIGNVSEDDCLLWGEIRNSSKDFLHQRVSLNNYTRLIDSDRASYEFSFDSGGIDAYSDSAYLTMQFRGYNGRPEAGLSLRKYIYN
jgi:hypothetical protein